MSNRLKVHGWSADISEDLLPGEDNACVISFRIANVAGIEYFVESFDAGKSLLSCKDGANGMQFALALANVGAAIYTALKRAKAAN